MSEASDPGRGAQFDDTKSSKISAPLIILSVFFFTAGIAIGILYRRLDADPVWVLLLIPFSFGMTGSLILFHFLEFSAHVQHGAYKIGGAVAGFVILFLIFYNLMKAPFLEELAWYKIEQGHIAPNLSSLADSYENMETLKESDVLLPIADSFLASLGVKFERMAAGGTYAAQINEWRGFYGDIDPTGKPRPEPVRETLKVIFEPDHTISASSTGPVKIGNISRVRKWVLSGFFTSDHLVMAEIAKETDEKPEINPNGVSIYYLQKLGSDYTGTIIYRDCVTRAVFRCPFAMTTDKDVETPRTRWPALFQRVCEREPLDPDTNRQFAAACPN